MSTNKKYYHFEDDLLKYPSAWCIAVWSKRGPGKTYSSLLYAMQNNIRFVYMRRTDKSVNRILLGDDQFDTSPYAPIERDYHVNIKGKLIDDGFGAYYKANDEGECVGLPLSYVLSFNKVREYKGFEFNSDWIIFDEFIPQKGERLNRAEGELLLDLYMTASRDRQKRGKDPLKLVLFSNAEDISTPITNELEIVDNMADLNASGQTHMWLPDRDILLHHITNEEVPITEEEQVGIYKGMYGTDWFRKSFEGEFSNNDFTNVTRRTLKKRSGFIHLHYKNNDYYIYLNKDNGNYYMCSHPTRCMFDFDLNRENEQKLFWMQYGVDLRISCIEERMKFEKYTMYDLIVNYKKFFNV